MHFPASLKLIGVALLSAFVAQAAPAWPDTQVMIKELRDSARRVVWSDDPGYLFRFLKNGDPLAPDDQTEYGLQTAIYETKGWEENGVVVAPVFALTEVANGKRISKSELPKGITVLTAGYYEERYWVVYTNKQGS